MQDLVDWKGGSSLDYERSIVWLESIEKLPFVRVVEVRCAKSRRGPLHLKGPERVVGYSKLMADTPRDSNTACYTRRLFYLKAEDNTLDSPPQHALDPRTVLPGVIGKPPSKKRVIQKRAEVRDQKAGASQGAEVRP
jgi:hypothetical protein